MRRTGSVPGEAGTGQAPAGRGAGGGHGPAHTDADPVRLVTLHVWRIPHRSLPRALVRVAVDRRRLRALPGVRFGKLLGTGTGDGFGPTDADPSRWAALVVWSDPARAAEFDETAVGRAWHAIATAAVRLDLRPLASRGRWAGVEPFGVRSTVSRPVVRTGRDAAAAPAHDAGEPDTPDIGEPRRPDAGRTDAPGRPLLALTRARLRPHRAVAFWRAVPPVAAALRTAPGLLARFGIGEAPIGWQGTVSVWRDTTSLTDFAYRHPEHRAAIIRTPREGWYAEELFARFEVCGLAGDPAVLDWIGQDGDRGWRCWPGVRSRQR